MVRGSGAWQAIYRHLQTMQVDDLLTRDHLAQLAPQLANPAPALRRAIKELQRNEGNTLAPVRGQGWRMAHPREHVDIAKKQQNRAAVVLARGRDVVVNTPIADLTATEQSHLRMVQDGLVFLASIVDRQDHDIDELRRQQDNYQNQVDDRLTKLEQLLPAATPQFRPPQ
jgi:hypothetical protein